MGPAELQPSGRTRLLLDEICRSVISLNNKFHGFGIRGIPNPYCKKRFGAFKRFLSREIVISVAVCALALTACGIKSETMYSIADSTTADVAADSLAASSPDRERDSEDKSGGNASETAAGELASASADVETRQETDDAGQGTSNDTQPEIVVYICGAVNRPGIYHLPDGSRVYQAVEAAGGLTEAADALYLNQAQRLLDGEQITVYTSEETEKLGLGPGSGPLTEDGNLPTGTAAGDAGASGSGAGLAGAGSGNAGNSGDGGNAAKVNLNTADRDTLMTLPGIGEAKADAILSYRETNGGFSSIEDIQNIPGIKQKAFEKIKDLITV